MACWRAFAYICLRQRELQGRLAKAIFESVVLAGSSFPRISEPACEVCSACCLMLTRDGAAWVRAPGALSHPIEGELPHHRRWALHSSMDWRCSSCRRRHPPLSAHTHTATHRDRERAWPPSSHCPRPPSPIRLSLSPMLPLCVEPRPIQDTGRRRSERRLSPSAQRAQPRVTTRSRTPDSRRRAPGPKNTKDSAFCDLKRSQNFPGGAQSAQRFRYAQRLQTPI